jgi:hypothetical protein
MLRLLLFLVVVATQVLQSQVQNPFSESAKDNDIAAYWYNVPRDSILIKVMGKALPFQSTLELYAESPGDSFAVSLTA